MNVMRRHYSTLRTVGAMLILLSCSSPKYTYNFDHYDYNSGKEELFEIQSTKSVTEPLKIDKRELVATVDPKVVTNPDPVSSLNEKGISKSTSSIKDLSKTEKKRLRKELRDYVRSHKSLSTSVDEGASVNATKQLDNDLKLAIIFGAIGITFAILGGINTVFWVIGVIGLIVGLVFFIRWISTQ
jgi:hypothetical protein